MFHLLPLQPPCRLLAQLSTWRARSALQAEEIFGDRANLKLVAKWRLVGFEQQMGNRIPHGACMRDSLSVAASANDAPVNFLEYFEVAFRSVFFFALGTSSQSHAV